MREALLVGDVVMVASIALALWVAARRSPFHAARRRPAAPTADLLPTPGRVRASSASRPPRPSPPRPSPACPPRAGPMPVDPATWSASQERADASSSAERSRRAAPQPPNVAPAPAPAPAPPVAPAVTPVVTPSLSSPRPVTDRSEPARSVLVMPRSDQWIVQRAGARRASSVHATRDAAEEQARRTARRERSVFEVRNAYGVVLDRIDFTASRTST